MRRKKMKIRLMVLLIILPTLVYILLFFNNYSKSWASDVEILAEINEQKITMPEINDFLSLIFEIKQPNKEDKKNLLDKIIAAYLIAPKAKEIGLHNDPIIMQELKNFREVQLIVCLKQKIEEQINLNNIFKNLIPEYGRKKVRFRQIVVQKRAKAEQILKEILNGGDFESLAKEKSINRYSKNGGDVGFVIMGKNTFAKEIENIIFKLQNNQISKILKTSEGYAIFKAVERKDLSDQEKEEIIANLHEKLSRERIRKLLEKLRSQAKIKIFSDNVEKIQEIKNINDDHLQIELVNVNGTIRRLKDVLTTIHNPTLNNLKSRFFLRGSILERLINNNINRTLLVNEALRIGLNNNLQFKKLIKNFEKLLLTDKYITEVIFKDIPYKEEEIKKYHDDHKDNPQYKNIPEYVHARRILVDEGNLAKEISEQLKKGADFTKMAQKYSMSPAINEFGSSGGDLGYLERGHNSDQRVSEYEKEAIFSLLEREIKIIKIGLGEKYTLYSIIKVEDKIKEGSTDYNEIKGLIKRELLRKKGKEKKESFIARLRSKANININFIKLEH